MQSADFQIFLRNALCRCKDRYQSAEELRGVLDMLNYSIVQDNRKKAETAFGKDNTISVVRTYRNIRDIIVKMYRKYQKRNYDIDTSWRRYLLQDSDG